MMKTGLELPYPLADIRGSFPKLTCSTRHRRAASIGSAVGFGGVRSVKNSNFSLKERHFSFEKDEPVALDSDFQHLLTAFQGLPALPFELEVNYRTLHPGLVREKRSSEIVSRSQVPIVGMHSAIPYSKKLPLSLYNSSSNRSAIEKSILQPTILHRIHRLADSLGVNYPTKSAQLESRLAACFQTSIETESKEYYSIWDRILQALEETVDKDSDANEDIDEGLSGLLEQLVERRRKEDFGEDWEADMSELTRNMRTVLGKVKSRQIATAAEQLWAGGVYLSYIAIRKSSQRRQEVIVEKPKPLKLKPLECPGVLLFKLVLDIQNEANDEIQKLKATIEGLHRDADHYVSLIKDREAELKELHSFASMRDFDRFSEELSEYLEDAAGRQIANAEVLETISQLLNHKWSGRRRRDTGKSSRSGSPEALRQASRQSTREEAQSPSRRKQHVPLFSTHERSNAESRGTTPRSPRVADPTSFSSLLVSAATNTVPLESVNTVERQGENSQMSPKYSRVSPSSTNRDLTTAGVEIRPPDRMKSLESDFPGAEDDAKEDMVVAEEDESEAESFRFEDKEVQTDLTMFSPDGVLTDSLSPVPPPTRHRRPNILLLQLEKLAKKQPPMPDKLVFKLFESAMDEKNRSDGIETEAGRPPKTMTEFMLDFMYMQYGLKTLTLKSLSALINALEGMASRGDKYGVLFCRLLEVFTDEPIDDTLAVFLTKARFAFGSRQPKLAQVKSVQELGGTLSLTEVSDLLYVLFLADREAGESVLSRLISSELSEADLTALLLCGKLAKTGRELKFFYVQIDSEKTGIVKYPAFEKGVRETCEILATKSSVSALWKTLCSDTLSFQQLNKLNFKELAARASSKELAITKCDFMLEIAREYGLKRAQEREVLTALFRQQDPAGEGVLTLSDFSALLASISPSFPLETAASIFREALDFSDNPENMDVLDANAFCYIALKHRLCNAGNTVFDLDLRQLSDRLRNHFVRYDHDQGDMAVATNKFRKKPQPRVM